MADAASGTCLGVYKALYAYAATGEDEVDMEEDQLVLLLERSDDECAELLFSFTPLLIQVSYNCRSWFISNLFCLF
jgi:hypothetical protein